MKKRRNYEKTCAKRTINSTIVIAKLDFLFFFNLLYNNWVPYGFRNFTLNHFPRLHVSLHGSGDFSEWFPVQAAYQRSDPESWSAKIHLGDLHHQSLLVHICSPVRSSVGVYGLEVTMDTAENRRSYALGTFTVLCNPWLDGGFAAPFLDCRIVPVVTGVVSAFRGPGVPAGGGAEGGVRQERLRPGVHGQWPQPQREALVLRSGGLASFT